jgi:hypothetical protein
LGDLADPACARRKKIPIRSPSRRSTPEGRWYALGDVLASLLLRGPAPKIPRAIRAVPEGRRYSKATRFRGAVELR